MWCDVWSWRRARSNLPPGCLWRLCRSASTLTEPFRPDRNVFCGWILQGFSAIWRSVSGLPKYHEICTFSIIFAKPGFMAYTWFILALPSVRSLWLFPTSMLSFSPNCWSCSWASEDLGRPFTPRLLMNALKASCMTCAMHGMWFLSAGHLIPEASSVDCSSRVIEWFEPALSVVIPSNRPSVSSKQTSTSIKCTACLAPGCWPLTYHP